MNRNSSKFVSLALLSAVVFLGSAPHAVANSTTRHIMVLPGACTRAGAFGPASATFIPGQGLGGGSLKLVSFNKGLDSSFAGAIVTSSQPGVGLTNIPLPMGTVKFTATNDTPANAGHYIVVGYYQNGSLDLGDGFLQGTKTFVVNTVQPNQGQLMAVSFLWLADGSGGGTATVTNFSVNGTIANGYDLTNEQECQSPYMKPVFNILPIP